MFRCTYTLATYCLIRAMYRFKRCFPWFKNRIFIVTFYPRMSLDPIAVVLSSHSTVTTAVDPLLKSLTGQLSIFTKVWSHRQCKRRGTLHGSYCRRSNVKDVVAKAPGRRNSLYDLTESYFPEDKSMSIKVAFCEDNTNRRGSSSSEPVFV